VKDHISTSGSQLVTVQPGKVVLQCRLEKLNDDWQRLITALHSGEQEIHAAWLLLLTPWQALSELISWLQSAENILQEGSSKSFDSLADVTCEQQKYRVSMWLHICSSV